MYYSKVKDCDIADGIGIRVSIFVSGCTNHCKNCFQPETWDFCFGQEYTQETEDMILDKLNHNYIRGLTLLGGEPMEPKNQETLWKLTNRVKKELPDKDIWCYTGFTYEKLMEEGAYPHTDITEKFLHNIDVLVDGRFMEEYKKLTLRFRGSENQRIINVKETLENGKVILLGIKDR